MKFPILFFVLFAFRFSMADILVVEGKPYSIQPTRLNVCGEAGGPEYQAAIMLLFAARNIGELNADALCKAGTTKMCTPEAKKKLGLETLFLQVRKYPSRFSNPACQALRKECERSCQADQIFSTDDCAIECNQYESYNR